MFSDAFDGCQHNNYARMPQCSICDEFDKKWDEEHPRPPIDWEKIRRLFILSGELFAKQRDEDMLKVFLEYDENKNRDSNREGNYCI